jgi:hypothetical protein
VYQVRGDMENHLFPLHMLGDRQTVIKQLSELVTWFDHASVGLLYSSRAAIIV